MNLIPMDDSVDSKVNNGGLKRSFGMVYGFLKRSYHPESVDDVISIHFFKTSKASIPLRSNSELSLPGTRYGLTLPYP